MRVTRCVPVLVLVVAVTGCGGSGSSRDAAGVRQTMHQFVNDLVSNNAAGACSLFTSEALTHTFGGSSGCQQLLARATKAPGEKRKLRREAKKIDGTPISVHGNTATVLNIGSAGSTTLTYVNGRWLIGTTSAQGSGTSTGG